MSQIKEEDKESRILKRSLTAVALMMFGFIPTHILGMLAAAVARHPVAEQSISGEVVYGIISFWLGGARSLPTVTLLMLFFVVGIGLAFLLRATGHAQSSDGMKDARLLLKKLLIPLFLSGCAFVTGFASLGTIKALIASGSIFLMLGIFAAFLYFIIDMTEDLPPEVEAKLAAMDDTKTKKRISNAAIG